MINETAFSAAMIELRNREKVHIKPKFMRMFLDEYIANLPRALTTYEEGKFYRQMMGTE